MIRKTILNLMSATGAFAPFRMANRAKALILTYHRFDKKGAGGAVSAREFEEHIKYLSSHYRITSLSGLAEQLRTDQSIMPGTAVITIDDGYRDAYDIAFPILRRYKASATLLVVTDFVDRKAWIWTDKLRFLAMHAQTEKLEATINNQPVEARLNGSDSRLKAASRFNSALKTMPDEAKEKALLEIASVFAVRLPAVPPDDYGPITWDQAREMESAGIEIGSHTMTHPVLTRVDDARLAKELAGSRARIEAMLGHDIDLLCYPNGNHDRRVRRASIDAGYRCAVTVELGFNGKSVDPMRLRRMDAEADFMRFIQITSGFDQIKNRLRRASASTP